ncbi:G8 domain-containing protein [Lacipirellula sp.]|uniref:G8 domain-containing protein n=1 Tax=Lacipirellula sp. TaxID=2691419 RepID=UPI003D0EA5E8
MGRGSFNGKKQFGFSRKSTIEQLESRVVMSAASIVPTDEYDDSETVATAPALLAVIVPPWLPTLTYQQFNLVTAETMPYLTTAQIASIPDADSFLRISEDARAAMTRTQVQALNIGKVGAGLLTAAQVSWLTPSQVQQLKFYEFPRLLPSQVPWLTAAQISTVPDPGAMQQWSAAQVAALTVQQVQAFNVRNVWLNWFSPTQISWLTVPQIQSLTDRDFRFLNANQVQALTQTQVASIKEGSVNYFSMWPAANRAALTRTQIPALNVNNFAVGLLTPTQMGWLAPGQVQQLKFYDFPRLSPSQVPWLTAAQIATVPDPGAMQQWSAANVTALTLQQVQAFNVRDVWLNWFSPTQISWLTVPQIQSLTDRDFRFLNAGQIPALSLPQVAAVKEGSVNYFSMWPAASRAALTQTQVQWLNINNAPVALLTSTQVGWLAQSQVQQLKFYELTRLTPAQVPWITTAQIASIPDAGAMLQWSDANLAALSLQQVRALNVQNVWIQRLPARQVGWLSAAQIQSLPYNNFSFLLPSQVPLLTTAQINSIPYASFLWTLPNEHQAALTREQLLSLPTLFWAEYTLSSGPLTPPDFHAGDDTDVHAAQMQEDAKALALVPLNEATHVAVASGAWSDPKTWRNGIIPSAGAKVVVAFGTTVKFDAYMTQAIKTLRIDGKLTFATNQNTQLKADTIVVTSGGFLHVGTAAAPIGGNFSARILIADNGAIDRVWDPYGMSRGLISMGDVKMFGAEKTEYSTLAVEPSAGDTKLYLAAPPKDWRVGDQLKLTGTNWTQQGFFTEELTVLAINGSVVTVRPLWFDHKTPAGQGLSMYVANVTRTVALVSENPSVPAAQRPHAMFMHNPNVELQNIGVYEFGRTDKSIPINDPVVINGVLQPGTGTNPRARYAIHFHHTGVATGVAPAVVSGSVVIGSAGWGFVNHQSNVVMEDNIAFGVNGASFVTEDGNERGAMRRNLSINATGTLGGTSSREANHDFGFGGHGFWFQGPNVEVVDNISAGSLGAAFAYFTTSTKALLDADALADPALAAGNNAIPVGAAPIREFSGNVAFAARTGLEIWHLQGQMTDGVSLIDDFAAWNITEVGIDLHYTGHVTVRNSKLSSFYEYAFGYGVQSNSMVHDLVLVDNSIIGFAVGVEAPVRRSTAIIGGYIQAVQGVFVEKGHDTNRSVYISGVTFGTLSASRLQGRTQQFVTMSGKYDFNDFLLRRLSSLYDGDSVTLVNNGQDLNLYYEEQLPNFVPFPSSLAAGQVPTAYLNKTNAQLYAEFGISFAGEVVANAFRTVGINGLVRVAD